MAQSDKDREGDRFGRLQQEPEFLPSDVASLFGDASACSRVGCLITRAVLGEEQYELHRLYCGDPARGMSANDHGPRATRFPNLAADDGFLSLDRGDWALLFWGSTLIVAATFLLT